MKGALSMGQIYSVSVVTASGEAGWIVDRNRTGSDNPIGQQIHRATFNNRADAERAARALAKEIRIYDIIPLWTESDMPMLGDSV